MKKAIIIAASILLLLFLIFRAVDTHHDQMMKERHAYVKKLNFEFSGKVDTTVELNNVNYGLIRFKLSKGSVDKSVEKNLNRNLNFNADLRFIIFTQDGKLAMGTQAIDKYKKGDSIYVNTNKDLITVFRGKTLINESKVSDNLGGRPF